MSHEFEDHMLHHNKNGKYVDPISGEKFSQLAIIRNFVNKKYKWSFENLVKGCEKNCDLEPDKQIDFYEKVKTLHKLDYGSEFDDILKNKKNVVDQPLI